MGRDKDRRLMVLYWLRGGQLAMSAWAASNDRCQRNIETLVAKLESAAQCGARRDALAAQQQFLREPAE